MDMNSLDELCTICDEHSLDIEVQHFLSIYPRMNISKNLSIRANNVDICNIKKIANNLKVTKAATVNSKKLLLEKIEVFYHCL